MQLSDFDAEDVRISPQAEARPRPPEQPRLRFLTAEGQSATPLELEALLGPNDLVDMNFLDRLAIVRECVGRVRLGAPGRSGWATGFLVAPGLLMTNQHVLPDADAAQSSWVEFGHWFDVAGQPPADPDPFALAPEVFFVADPDLDFAVVALSPRSRAGKPIDARGYLRLIQATGKIKAGEYATILQHPDGVPMQVALRENEILPIDEHEPFISYAADTAHGSSGAPVFNDSFQLVALHARGKIRRDAEGRFALAAGGWTASLDGLRESDVLWEKNVGYRVSRICASLLEKTKRDWPQHLATIEAAMRGGDVLSNAVEMRRERPDSATVAGSSPDAAEPELTRDAGARVFTTAAGAVAPPPSLVVPFQIRVSLEAGAAGGDILGAARLAEAQPRLGPTALEREAVRLRRPVIHDGLEERDGFKPLFLELPENRECPMPKLTEAGERVAAPLLDGSGFELRYHHFSIWMHAERRLALWTAANVDWRNRPEKLDGRRIVRDVLNGFPPDERYAEEWVTDHRLDPRHQLPDGFYTDDRGAFDKGHIVRRDDVCWGTSFDEVQMANGDTFHTTNCSPQIKAFNQGAHGAENWGDLEEHVRISLGADAEMACIFAGPALGPEDRWFRGHDEVGEVRVQIPSAYWKIVVVRGRTEPLAFGFLLTQDVRPITEQEFRVTAEWIGAFKPIAEIADCLGGLISLSKLVEFDQFEVERPRA